MISATEMKRRIGTKLTAAGNRLLRVNRPTRAWIDVGAHQGQNTLGAAKRDPSLLVYAFEPNLKLAAKMWGLIPNFIVVPMAVAEHDGAAEFHLNADDQTSSLLPFDRDAVNAWIGGEQLEIDRDVSVPTIRLDTFLGWMQIPNVDFLKIDTQGADFSVVKSLGSRLPDIRKITLEVDVSPRRLYVGAADKAQIRQYLESFGFALTNVETQSHGQEENLTFSAAPPGSNGAPK